MNLIFNDLIKYNLYENVEKSLRAEDNNKLSEFVNTIQEINSIDQFIKDFPSYPGSTKNIIRDEMISGIGATLAIEGTLVDKDEILESFRKADLKEKLQRKEQEVENSKNVYWFIRDLMDKNSKEFVYSEGLIKQIHKLFTENMNYLSNTPGDYRGEFNVEFGNPRRNSLCKTRSEVEIAMKKFVEWINKPQKGIFGDFSIVKAILAHYYLVEIHPFGDGNGRTARALESLILYKNGINHYCFWSLANFWSRNREKYIIHLGDIFTSKNPMNFILWGLCGYKKEIKRIKFSILKKVKQLMFMDYTNYLYNSKKKNTTKINSRIKDVLLLLTRWGKMPMNEFLFSPEITAYYKNVKNITKRRDLKKMEFAQLIKLTEENNEWYIEPNFSLLESLEYNV